MTKQFLSRTDYLNTIKDQREAGQPFDITHDNKLGPILTILVNGKPVSFIGPNPEACHPGTYRRFMNELAESIA